MTTEETRAATAPSAKAVIAVVIGNWLEFYDFLVFTFFAVMIGDAFFPGTSETARLLGALATFGVGFVTRPIGAAVIGAYADKAGRKNALTLTLFLMGLGSGLVAVTPGYAQIGIAAPIILLIARLIQGFSCGGEVGPATSYLLETAPVQKRAFFTAFQAHSQAFASITGSFVGLVLALTLSKEDLYAWGWRVPFAIGLLVAPIGLYIRRKLPDTIERARAHTSSRALFGDLFRHHWPAMILGVFIISGSTISTYVFNYMATYAIRTLHLPEAVGTAMTMTGSAAAIGGIALGTSLDRVGRKRIVLLSRILFIIVLLPAYMLMTQPGMPAWSILGINAALYFIFAMATGLMFTMMSEAFPTEVRASGLSILYAVGVAVFGGTTQFAVAWLIDVLHSPLVPAWYQGAANLLTLIGVLLLVPHGSKKLMPAPLAAEAAASAEAK